MARISSVDQTRRNDGLVRAKRLAIGLPGIQGVDFGYLYRDGRRTRRQGIRFHVSQKLSPSRLASEHLLPRQINGIACDVIQASYMAHAMVDPLSAADPLRPGVSIGNQIRRASGTLGVFVSDTEGGAAGLLSNWHVLVADLQAQAGEPIIQPAGAFSGPNPGRQVASLGRWLNLDNGFDAAFAYLQAGVAFDREPANLQLVPSGLGDPVVGMRVVKSGSISGRTAARVDGVQGSYPINYDRFGAGTRWMRGIHLVPDPLDMSPEVSLAGDSGALWVDRDSGKAIALNFAGEDNMTPLYEYALAHPISDVLHALRLELA